MKPLLMEPIASVAALLAALGAGSIGTRLVERALSRKQAKITEAQQITEAAIDLLAPYKEEVVALRSKVANLEGRLETLRAQQYEQYRRIHEHVMWDSRAIAELAAKGVVSIGTPPPLMVVPPVTPGDVADQFGDNER